MLTRLALTGEWLAATAVVLLVVGCNSTSETPRAPAARRYREVTKHTPESVRVDGVRLDWANKPAPYREYPGTPTLPLPPPRVLDEPALAVIAGTGPQSVGAAALDAELLGTVLFLTAGITRPRPSGGDIRATAAAGALYPNELYVVAADLPGLAAGVYHYTPTQHGLRRLRGGDWRGVLAVAADDPEVRAAPVTLALTGILWRSAWKYRERAYRHLFWDGGMMLAHVLAAARAARQPATILAAFVDADVDRALGLDGKHESTLALVRLGAPAAAAPAGSPSVPPLDVRPAPLSPRPLDHPEALRYQEASTLPSTRTVRAVRAARLGRPASRPPSGPVETLPAPLTSAASLDGVVRRRSSARRFAVRPVTVAQLATVLALPARGLPADFLDEAGTLLETYLIVNAVEGLGAGAYHYRRDEHGLERLAGGDFRDRAGFLCLEQALCRDASAVLYYLTDLERAGRAFGERGYRLAELEGGLLAGRAYLAAHALGRGVSALTFYDDEVTRFFSPHAARLEPLIVVALGIPARWP